MKKTELLSIILIIFGLNTFIYGVVNVTEQYVTLTSIQRSQNETLPIIMLIGFLGASVIIFLISYFLIFKSDAISKKILKKDGDLNIQILISKDDAIQIFLIIVSLFILLSRFPAFLGSISSIIMNFFKDNIPHNNFRAQDIGTICLYIFCFVVLTNSKQITNWLIIKID